MGGLANVPLDAIDRGKVARDLRTPAYHDDAPINGFDTETREDGRIYLLTYALDGRVPNGVGNHDLEPISAAAIFDKLTHREARTPASNVWYNLDFDVNALIGTIMSKEQATELADTNSTTFQLNGTDYDITYIKGKFLSIQDEHRHRYMHYDISQFFGAGLDKAATDWLGAQKDDVDIENPESYDWLTLVEYAEKDAMLTRDLWREFISVGEGELSIPLGKPISTGFVAMHVVFDELQTKPAWGSTQLQKMAANSYHGGRFEVYRRGFFDDVIGLDINSAYPYHMSEMPDLSDCTIEVRKHHELEAIRQANWGFVRARVSTDGARNIQPFALKENKVIFPKLQRKTITVTKDEFLFALDNGYLHNYEIFKTGLVFEREQARRPFGFLKSWYDDRNHFKDLSQEANDKYDKIQYILKIIMNSTYGKTCQVTEKHEYLGDRATFRPEAHEFVTEGYTGKPIKGWYEGGDLFNPFYATYITAKTRLQLHKAAIDLGVEDSTIMFATDCLMIEADAISESQLESYLAPEDLGAWDFDYKGSGFVVGSGVYDVFEDGKLSKMAKRGFKEVTKTYDSWREAAADADGLIELPNERPARFKEWLTHDAHPRPAEFFHDKRTLNPDFDSKRRWSERATFAKLLAGTERSKPLTISG